MLTPPRTPVPREFFDPTNERHLASMDAFIKTGNWGNVQFYPELPYAEVPMTVLMKHAEHVRGIKRETEEARQARLSSEKPNLIPFKLQSPQEEQMERAFRIESGNRRLEALLPALLNS